jgi:glutamyl endopeptidase
MTQTPETTPNTRRLLALAAALLLVPGLAWAASPHAPIASDGTVFEPLPAAEAAALPPAEPGFRGTGRLGDALAEYPAGKDSPAEVMGLLSLPLATGKIGIESIIGTDTRVRITPTTSYPARAVVLITMTGGRCTGWLYGPDIVATAGHCVHSGGPGGKWSTSVRVYPGRNGTSSPFGSCTARTLYSVAGWVNSSYEQYDYGAIKLNCTIGNTVGWFGYWWQSASLTGLPVLISGYPGDKPLTQWRSKDLIRVTQTRQVFYRNDTVGGMSGSPVYNNWASGSPCAGHCAMAIHAYGLHGASPHSTSNHGTRIVQAVFNNLLAWKNAP